MKITESYLRKIIRGTLNEMFSGADMNPLQNDVPPQEEPSEMSGMTSSEIVDHILNQYHEGGQIDQNLLSLLQTIKQNEDDAPSKDLGMSFSGLGESKRRK